MPPNQLKEVKMNTRTGYAAAALCLAALVTASPAIAERADSDRQAAAARVSSAEIAAEASQEAAAEASRAIVREAEKDLDLRLNALISNADREPLATIAAN